MIHQSRRAVGGLLGAIVVAVIVILAAILASFYFGASRTGTGTSTTSTTSSTSAIITSLSTSLTSSTLTVSVSAGQAIPISSVENANVSLGGSPRVIAVNPQTNRIYTTDYFSSQMTVIDAVTYSVVAKISLPATPDYGMAVDPKANTIFVPLSGCTNIPNASNSCNAPGAGQTKGSIAEVDGTTNTIARVLPFDVRTVAMNPTNDMLYALGGGGGSVLAIDARTGSLASNLSLGMGGGGSMAVNPNTNMVYIAGCKSSFVCGGWLLAINGTSMQVKDNLTLGFGSYSRVTVNPTTGVAYLAGDASLVAINGTTDKIIYSANKSTCATVDALDVNAQTNQVYAVPLGPQYVLVYDGSNGRLVNMYFFSTDIDYVKLNPVTHQLYATLFNGHLVIFPDVTIAGHVDSQFLSPAQNCGLP